MTKKAFPYSTIPGSDKPGSAAQATQANFDAIRALLDELADLASIDFSGTGDPNGVVTAQIGARYRRLDGGLGTSLYVKEADPTGNTGWSAK